MHLRALSKVTVVVVALAAVLGQWAALAVGLVLLAAERHAWPPRRAPQVPVP